MPRRKAQQDQTPPRIVRTVPRYRIRNLSGDYVPLLVSIHGKEQSVSLAPKQTVLVDKLTDSIRNLSGVKQGILSYTLDFQQYNKEAKEHV